MRNPLTLALSPHPTLKLRRAGKGKGKTGNLYEFYWRLGYISKDMNPKYKGKKSVFCCPSWQLSSNSADDNNHYTTYGVFRGRNYFAFCGGPSNVFVKITRARSPSTHPYAADSILFNPAHARHLKQSYAMYIQDSSHAQQGYVHLRYNGRANVLCADGHVETCNPDGLVKLGGYNATSSKFQAIKASVAGNLEILTW